MVNFASSQQQFDWEPTSFDIAWAEDMVRILKDGAVWVAPGSGHQFVFHKAEKEIHLVDGDPSHRWFWQSVVCFGKIGWTVLDKTHQTSKPKRGFDFDFDFDFDSDDL